MSQSMPELDDYLRLFAIYEKDLGSIYQESADEDPYNLLFEQVTKLLIRPSAFNLSLPEPFRNTAHRYRRGDAPTLQHFADADNRHFMLCDLHDLVMLKGGLQKKREKTND